MISVESPRPVKVLLYEVIFTVTSPNVSLPSEMELMEKISKVCSEGLMI